MKRTFVVSLGLSLSFLLCLTIASAQSAPSSRLPLGSLNGVTALRSCPYGFYPGASCYQATVSCPGTEDIGVTYSYSNPSGIPRGAIVMFNGSGGTEAFGTGYGQHSYVTTYLQAGYQVVQTAWDTDWEITSSQGSQGPKIAACRPATLLNYFHQNFYKGDGGMCSQGASAGSGALAYALSYYGSGDYLDKVELLSGPVFGDIEQGCEEPDGPSLTVCSRGQYGCVGQQWTLRPQYVQGAQNGVSKWTGHKCQPGNGATPSQTNSSWKAMSIVDGTNTPSFVYPQTAMAGWLCSNGLNNSAAQAQFYYQKFTSRGQAAEFSVTRIDNCTGPEGVGDGITPAGKSGFIAITSDMTDPVAGCIKRH
jgi:hypothetical protein